MTEPCECFTWAGDMRVGRPNGHHPRCPQQPEPGLPVELIVSTELITGFLKLPAGALILNAKMAATPITEFGTLKFVVHMPNAPEHAVSMEPACMVRYWPDGRWRDYYLSAITWRLADGTTTTQTFEPPADASAPCATQAVQLAEDGIVSPSEVLPWTSP